MPGLTPDQVQRLHELIHTKNLIQAIQVYRDATGVSLAEAREAIEEMALNEATKPPSSVRDHDNPVLESKIKSLLAKNKKLEAIQIYQQEYGVSLNDAKAAVERMQSSMALGGISDRLPYEPAIGADPFAEGNGVNRGAIVIFGFVMALAICGVAVFIFLLSS
jgi:ribosomal protein L7/L12